MIGSHERKSHMGRPGRWARLRRWLRLAIAAAPLAFACNWPTPTPPPPADGGAGPTGGVAGAGGQAGAPVGGRSAREQCTADLGANPYIQNVADQTGDPTLVDRMCADPGVLAGYE